MCRCKQKGFVQGMKFCFGDIVVVEGNLIGLISDFIKSWLYYPTLCKWFKSNNYNGFKDSRFRYAIKHCCMRKMFRDTVKQKSSIVWTSTYQQNPIIK